MTEQHTNIEGLAAQETIRVQANRIATLEATNAAQAEQLAAKQAQIDALMLEYCPDEMTPEQVEEWGKHQRPASKELQAALDALIPSSTPPEPQAGVELPAEPYARIKVTADGCSLVEEDGNCVVRVYSGEQVKRALNQRQAVKAEQAANAWVLESDIIRLQGVADTLKRAGERVISIATEPLSAAQGVPEGWKLVPKVPTPDMLRAAFEVAKDADNLTAMDCYNAMLSAAPEQAESKEGKL